MPLNTQKQKDMVNTMLAIFRKYGELKRKVAFEAFEKEHAIAYSTFKGHVFYEARKIYREGLR